MSALDGLVAAYKVILCDIWGVVHDGVNLYPGVAERLVRWRAQGKTIVLVTNAPRTAEAVEQQLHRIGLPRQAWDGIATSGEAGIAALNALGEAVGFLGTEDDRAILVGRGVRITPGQDFHHAAVTGLDEQRRQVGDYSEQLRAWAADRVVFHCLNPDRIVVRGGIPEPCAGALADVYERLGGSVCWYGKPHRAIYDHALKLAGDPPADRVLAIGDALQTDVLGAARMGFDCVFVQGGIHSGEPFPAEFGRENGLGDWLPVAVIASLG